MTGKAKPSSKIIIVGINLILLAAYTVCFKLNSQELIILAEAIFIGAHVVICLLLAIFVYRKEFLLSALVVLLIGFSTCWVVFS